MQMEPGEAGGAALAGLIIDDGHGRYFVIAWADLLRFRVPDTFGAALRALAEGAEPDGSEADVGGFVDAGVADGTRSLLLEVLDRNGAWDALPVARRLAAWALVR